jgi:hypothetical protein
LQMICDFISSNPLAFQSYGMDFFSIPFCIWYGWVSSLFIFSEACETVFEHGYPFIHTMLWQVTVLILCWKSWLDLCLWYTFSPKKSDHCMLFFFCVYGKRRGRFDTTVTQQLTVQGRNCFTVMQSPCMYLHLQWAMQATKKC